MICSRAASASEGHAAIRRASSGEVFTSTAVRHAVGCEKTRVFAAFSASSVCQCNRHNEKGHGNSIRRSAMTSILKRDHVWPRPPGRSIPFVSAVANGFCSGFLPLEGRVSQQRRACSRCWPKIDTGEFATELARAAFLTAAAPNSPAGAARQFQAFPLNSEIQVELSKPGAGAGCSIASGIGPSAGAAWGAGPSKPSAIGAAPSKPHQPSTAQSAAPQAAWQRRRRRQHM